MKLTDIFTLCGGLALFLYGMKMMSDGLETAAGNKMKAILEKLTTNRFLGVAVGAFITAIIQSSSATTVMVVGFVNSGLMKLTQAVWVIMGANIGTTITGQLIALDIGMIAPLIAFVGVILISFVKSKKIQCTGQIIAGIGVLFIGMNLMSGSMEPLQDSPEFIAFMTQFKNPLLGILAGAVFTAVIQSSSASVGILQALAMSGIIGLDSAVFVLFGQNIGTCITAVIASIGTNRNAKRTTLIHLMFNIIGTMVFVAICLTTPFTEWIADWTGRSVEAQIANVHTIFNVVTTLLLLPFGTLLAKLSTIILPLKANEDSQMKMMFVTDHNIGSSAIAVNGLKQEIGRMFSITQENLSLCMEWISEKKAKSEDKIRQNEHYIDFLNEEITRYTAQISTNDMTQADSSAVTDMFQIVSNIERIGDHALNIAEYRHAIQDKKNELSKAAKKELNSLHEILNETISILTASREEVTDDMLRQIVSLENSVDDLIAEYRTNQINRLKKEKCSVESCVLYSEMLTDLERISDHLLNIAQLCHHSKTSILIPAQAETIIPSVN